MTHERISLLTRIRAAVRRLRAMPTRTEESVSLLGTTIDLLKSAIAEIDRLEHRTASIETMLRESDLSELATLGIATTLDEARRTAFVDLRNSLGGPAALRPGLSVLTATWNHAGFLPSAVASGLATLDLLPPDHRGEMIVLDDASIDETEDVLNELVNQDPRVRAIRAPRNLGLPRGRNILLHVTPTEHALFLDADNTSDPAGIAAVYDVARRWRPAFTYGNVVMTRADNSDAAVASQEPLTSDYFFAGGPHIDSLSVVDAGYLRMLGGYTTDPVFDSFDDHEIIHRIARRGGLFGFVPVVAGHYRVDDLSMSTTRGRVELTVRRLRRSYGQDGGLHARQPASFAAHPATGPLWATTPAVEMRPELAEARQYQR